jgi:hypothetical protein
MEEGQSFQISRPINNTSKELDIGSQYIQTSDEFCVASTCNGSNMFARYKAQTIIITPNSIMHEIIFIPFDEIKESQNRLLAIIEIEHDVNLIKKMFLQLNSMIEEQQPLIDTIVVHVEEVKTNSKVANDDISQANRYSGQYNSKITKIIMISTSSIIFVKLLTTII